MRRCQSIAVIGRALIGRECRAVVITPHDALNLQHHDDGVHAALPMQVGAWHDTPAGDQFAAISGDPAKPAPLVMPLKLPPGYRLSPYRRGAVLQIFGMGLVAIEGSSFHTPGAQGS
jgi:hypothetical protein